MGAPCQKTLTAGTAGWRSGTGQARVTSRDRVARRPGQSEDTGTMCKMAWPCWRPHRVKSGLPVTRHSYPQAGTWQRPKSACARKHTKQCPRHHVWEQPHLNTNQSCENSQNWMQDTNETRPRAPCRNMALKTSPAWKRTHEIENIEYNSIDIKFRNIKLKSCCLGTCACMIKLFLETTQWKANT